MNGRTLEVGANAGAHVVKFAIAQIAQNRTGLSARPGEDALWICQHVAARNKQVFPAVVIEIVDAVAPSRHFHGGPTDAATGGGVIEQHSAAVEQQREALFFERRVPDIRLSVIVHVAEIDAH